MMADHDADPDPMNVGRPTTPNDKPDPLQEHVVHPDRADAATPPTGVPAVDEPEALQAAAADATPAPAPPDADT
jgi:hypothetical protein